MPLTLEQYASYLDTRKLPWPSAPPVTPARARPHLKPLPGLKAVLWNVYGTLLAIAEGELLFEHPNPFVMDLALEKTVQEFKMWGSMSRKPGQPSEYMKQIYIHVLHEQRMAPGGGERYPEIPAERIWDAIVKKLQQKDYKFDAAFYGAIGEFTAKVAYFFHASLQGTACYPGAAAALAHVSGSGRVQGLLADGQSFTAVQLQRGLAAQEPAARLADWVPADLRFLSHEHRARKPSERLFRAAQEALARRGISPSQVLHVGSRLDQDIIPARKAGFRTAIFAGDRASLQATPERLKAPASRPDVLLTQLDQLAEVVV